MCFITVVDGEMELKLNVSIHLLKLRQHIIELHPDNRRHLDAIETSTMLLVLDRQSPESKTEVRLDSEISVKLCKRN